MIDNDIQQIYLDLAWHSTVDLYHAEMDSNCVNASELSTIATTAPLDEFANGLTQLLTLQNWTHIVLIIDQSVGNSTPVYCE